MAAWAPPRARPPMRRGLKHFGTLTGSDTTGGAARAAPYEKGTETVKVSDMTLDGNKPRARPPMRRGLKPIAPTRPAWAWRCAARAAPYEKGTETILRKLA